MSESFADSETEVVSFFKIGNNQRSTEDCSVATIDIVSKDHDAQTTFKKSVEIQTETIPISVASEYNKEALLEFMRRVVPQVENELRKRNKYFGGDFKQNLSEEDEIPTKRLYDLKKCDRLKNVKSRHLSWSCFGNKLAISYSHVRHETWCKHMSYVVIYDTDKNDEFKQAPKQCIELNSCVVDLKFHPTLNSVLIFVTEEGRIYWHNTTESLENNSKNFMYHKNEKIIQISWINVSATLYLAVGGGDGLLYFWITSPDTNDWILHKKFSFQPADDTTERAVQCFAFSPLNTRKFVTALEGGILVSCIISSFDKSNESQYAVVNDFECPRLVIKSICFSSFEENTFVTGCIDQRIRVYYVNEKAPVYVISTDFVPMALEWSHLQEKIFQSWATDGEIRFYNYQTCFLVKTIKLLDHISSGSFKVKGMKQLFVAANTDIITIWQTALYITRT